MSVRCSLFYGDADGHHWHAWHNPIRSRRGVFVEVCRGYGEDDDWGYPELEVEVFKDGSGAELQLFLPRAVCEAIAKWVAENPK